MKKTTLILAIIIACISTAFAQIRYSLKAEAGYLKYNFRTLIYEPTPGGRGYYLNTKQNGIDFNIINGINISDRLYAGIGLGYLNFEGIHGASAFADLILFALKEKRFSPLFSLRLGRNHIWNQYDNGTGSAHVEPGAGIIYRITPKTDIYLRTGLLFTQQALLIPLRLGVSF